MTQLSPHFSLPELTFSQESLRVGIDNTPNAQQIANLTQLCVTLLEPIRALLSVPLHVDSGYRSPIINADVGGSSDSAHMAGCAADVIPIGMRDPAGLRACFDKIRAARLPLDELIIECGSWLHCGMAKPGTQPRYQYMVASGGPGNWSYVNA